MTRAIERPVNGQTAVSANGLPPETAECFTAILQTLQTMKNGDFSVRLPVSWTGLAGKIADNFNEIVTANEQMASELKRVGLAVGKKGKIQERLRKPFFSTKSIKGTGLGVWISKGILQKYDGRISFRSFCPGSEAVTTFRVFFPSSGVLNLTPAPADSISNESSLSTHASAFLHAQFSSDQKLAPTGRSLLRSA